MLFAPCQSRYLHKKCLKIQIFHGCSSVICMLFRSCSSQTLLTLSFDLSIQTAIFDGGSVGLFQIPFPVKRNTLICYHTNDDSESLLQFRTVFVCFHHVKTLRKCKKQFVIHPTHIAYSYNNFICARHGV